MLRNQLWNQQGELIGDIELYLDDGILKAKDRLTGKVREPTEAETEQFYPKPVRNLEAEIDELRGRVEGLESK